MAVKRKLGPEALLHLAVCQFLDVALPKDAIYFHIPAEGKRDPRSGAFLKRMGSRAGLPDLIVLWNGKALGIELKSAAGQLTEVQSEMQAAWRRARVHYFVARTVPDVAGYLLYAGVPLRAEVAV